MTWRGEPRVIQLWSGKLGVILCQQSSWLLAWTGCVWLGVLQERPAG